NANDTTDFGTCVLETDILGDIKEVASSHYGDSEYIAWMDNLSIEIEDSVKFR
ncbi:MAG: hypothetical protein HRT89_02655, partial [Lentisphaeria bacterium]|nr:hypothetical protein [Lentisphaeria bacterium]